MSRIQLASNLDDARGKIGNIVYSKGRSVHTQRKRVKPTNPQTSYQATIRTLVSAFSSFWRTLLPDQILSWNEAALQQFKSNVFGAKYHTTGHKLFVATNVNAKLVGYSSTIYGPANPAHPHYSGKINTFTATSVLPNVAMQVINGEFIPDGAYLLIEATPQMSPGISAYKRKFVPIKVVKEAFDTNPIDLLADYTNRFGSLIAGKKIAVRSRIVWGGDFQKTGAITTLDSIVL